ncbi:MAG: bifunctional adenosylcobinamide kinase/adenosylcobinamide-phosphate guanylyltransferase [Thermodesulfobacteriota bacterium]|nr:bifunctional adenosylcobinamide kinase/adenosylcobinamide-phosphate guanylyltransferase [Thermodesulfobacteriota bacterium]
MKKTILVTGGCRSGKSRFALDYANRHFTSRLYLATGQALDEEMKERIRNHRKDRGQAWRTVEEPMNIARAIDQEAATAGIILIDCITMWVSNMLFQNMPEEEIMHSVGALAEKIHKPLCSFILVTNEVGAGIVPENRLARRFRDLSGMVNQKLAACADEVYWLVAGIPIKIK